MAGKPIRTIEGLAQGGRLHPLQQAFLDAGALQCGYCTPGMIMAGVALLQRMPRPARSEIVAGCKAISAAAAPTGASCAPCSMAAAERRRRRAPTEAAR